jgi:quinolinate synthase
MEMESTIKAVEYDRPVSAGTVCSVGQAWAKVPDAPSAEERAALKARIKTLLAREKAVLVAHYYVDAELQELADETGGCVADSLEMARFGRDHDAKRSSWPACASWAKPRRSSAPASAC